ncbi:hypothetical protein BDN70DRAFT_939553 [Pholiota conissans]|uniref:Uncharacterized protein n=1 Tax=Pholiota conissans TaxID=109636 RepID=A0A9P6CSI3_9AGAR|nr:hypothetical protein BDN70DRAFT_939553 [Pholiota conissans]
MMLNKWEYSSPTEIKEFEALFSLQAGDLESLLSNLLAVVHCIPNTTTEVKFLHASLGDFILDQSRSGEYYIDLEEQQQRLLCIFLESHISDRLYYDEVDEWRIYAIEELLVNAKATAPIQNSILKFKMQDSFFAPTLTYASFYILDSLRNFDFGDRGQAYHHVLNVFATKFAKMVLTMPSKFQKGCERGSTEGQFRDLAI